MTRVTILLLSSALLGSIATNASATFPGENGRILYVSESSTLEPELRARSVNQPGFTPLGAGLFPDWSPDGTRIVFTEPAEGRLALIESDGSGLTYLSDSPSADATWSPDGARIAFSQAYPGLQWPPARFGWCAEIFVMNADGSESQRLTGTGSCNLSASWSPSGEQIAFVRCEGTASLRPNYECTGPTRLFVMNADGSDVTELNLPDVNFRDPDWSPDGKVIVAGCGSDDICLIDLEILGMCASASACPALRRIFARRAAASEPTWSPNGLRIAFVIDPRTEEDADAEIYVMRRHGSRVRQVTDNARNDRSPDWGPR